MPSGTDKRLDKVTEGLSPTEAILLWLNEIHQHGNMAAYLFALKDEPPDQYPLYRLPRQMRYAVWAARNGKSRGATDRAEQQAVREVVFLYSLVQQSNLRLWSEWRTMCLQLAYATSQLQHLVQVDDRSPVSAGAAVKLAVDAAIAFIQWDLAIRAVADRYFRGTGPLFPQHAELLVDALDACASIIKLGNDQLAWVVELANQTKQRKVVLPAAPIDLAEVKQTVTPHALDLARHLVVMAKVEAAEFIGENQEALALLKARLWPQQS
jgi:hypothetical protein